MELCHSISAGACGCWPRMSARLFWTRFLVLGVNREPELISICMMDDCARLGGEERAERFELFE